MNNLFSRVSWPLSKKVATKTVATLACALVASPASMQIAGAQNFNLASTHSAMVAPNHQPVILNIGGTAHAIQPGQAVTPAEFVALSQVLNLGTQSLLLGASGNAIGGQFSVGTLGAAVSALAIPHGVSGLVTNSPSPNLSMSGVLSNAGKLYVLQSQTDVSASDIINMQGALISTVIPSSLSALVRSSGPIDLTLTATNSISNAGTIIGSGSVNLITPSVTNSSLIESVSGNINFSSATPSNITVNNAGGVLQALSGNINVRNATFAGPYDFTITGGNLLSNNVNIWSGGGAVNVDVNTLSGALNVTACTAHVLTDTANLQLGTMNLSGDPTYYNAGGDITIDSSIATSGADLAILAKGSIFSSDLGSVSTSDATNGGNVLMIAGAKFTPTAGGGSSVSGQGSGDTTTTFTVTGASSMGGRIDLSNLTGPIDTSSSGGTAGNVTLVAFGGQNSASGRISTVNVPIDTASGNGTSGNVVMLAGARSGNGIETGALTTTTSGTSTADGGQVLLVTAVPSVGSGFTVNSGTVTNGTVTAGTILPSSITVGSVTTNSAPVTIVTGGNVNLAGAIATSGTDSANTLNRAGGNLTVLAGGSIVTSSATVSIDTSSDTSSGGTLASGGNVVMVAGANLTSPAFSVNPASTTVTAAATVSGASATGGNIDLTGGGANDLLELTTAASGSVGAAAGNVQLISYKGTLPSVPTGNVALPSAVTIITAGDPTSTSGNTSTNGDVTILAGATSGTSINIGNVNTAGGYGGGGSITIQTAQATSGLPYSYSFATGSSAVTTTGALSAGAMRAASAVVGNLTAAAGTQYSATGLATAITVNAGNNLTIGAVTDSNNLLSSSSTSAGAAITLTAGGVMSFASGASITSIPIQALSGINGGTITIQAQSFNFTNSGTVAVIADGIFDQSTDTTSNDGGSITIVGTGTGAAAGGGVLIGPGFFQLSAQADVAGGNGGTISVTSNSNITVTPQDATPTSYLTVAAQSNDASLVTGNGGTIILKAASGNVLIQSCNGCSVLQGGLDASGAPSTLDGGGAGGFPGGNGGTISITTNSSTPFVVFAGVAIGANGSEGPLTANGNLVVASSPLCNTCVDATGAGGTVSIKNLGSGGITVNDLTVSISVTPGIQVQAGDSQTAGSNYYMGGQGGNISLIASGAGGQVSVLAPGSAPTVPGNLDASGGQSSANLPGGSGGTITIVTNSTNYFDVGPSLTTNGAGSLSALGNNGTAPSSAGNISLLLGQGNGGAVSVTNMGKGGIYVEPIGGAILPLIDVAAQTAAFFGSTGAIAGGYGGSITLKAPTGPVLSLSSLDASGGGNSGSGANPDGGPGGYITIVSNSNAHAFAVGTSSTNNGPSNVTPGTGNGVLGTLTAEGFSGGNISITNLGTAGVRIGTGLGGSATTAAISVQTFVTANVGSQGGGNGGNISLEAPSGTVAIYAALDASGMMNANMAGSGGSIYILSNSSSPFLVNKTLSATNPNGCSGVISADGQIGAASNGNGGEVTIINNGGSINIASTVAAGIGVTATAPPSLPNPLQTAGSQPGTGGTIILEAPAPSSTVLVNGSLSANGGFGNSPQAPVGASNTGVYASGNGGSIVIVCNSATTFRIGVGVDAPTTNGVNGTLTADGFNGGSISVENLAAGGIRVGNGASSGPALTAVQAAASDINGGGAGGNGGSITLTAPLGSVGVVGSLNVSGAPNTYAGTGSIGYGGVVAGTAGAISITTGATTVFGIDPASQSNPAPTTFNGIYGMLMAQGGLASNTGGSVGTSGSTTNGSGGSISVVNLKGGISIGTAGAVSVSVQSSTNLAGDGGSISLQAPNGPVQIVGGLTADGGLTSNTMYNSGLAGSISITAKSSGSNPFNIGGATTAKPDGTTLPISASGWDGGQISITNYGTGGIVVGSGDLLVTAASANTNLGTPGGPGGSIALQAPKGPVLITGGLSANGGQDSGLISTTASGTITPGINNQVSVVSSSNFAATQFAIISGTVPWSTTMPATGCCSPTNPVGNVTIPLANDQGFVKGGTATIDTSNGPENYTIQAVGTNGANFIVVALTYAVAQNASVTTSSTGTEREQVIPAPSGTPANTLVFNDIQNNYNSGATISTYYPGGNGGQISILSNTAAKNPFTVGTPTTNGVSGGLSARGANGGSITITNLGAGGISVANPSNISIAPRTPQGTNILDPVTGSLVSVGGNGGQFYLNALGTGGFVYIGNNLNASGGAAYSLAGETTQGSGGVIAITSNTAAKLPFTVGTVSPGANGINGTLTANGSSGGSIGILNLGAGGISFNASNFSVAASAGQGGNIDLEAPKGPLTSTSGGTLSADAGGGGTFAGGTITFNTTSLVLNSLSLTLSATADQDSNVAGNGGTIIINQSTGVLNVGATNNLTLSVDGTPSLGNGGTIILSAPAGIAVSGGLNTSVQSLAMTGTIEMTVSGKGTISSGSTNGITTGTLILSTGLGTSTLPAVSITTNVASLSLAGTGGNVTITNNGALVISQASQSGTGNLSISASGITVGGVISAPSSSVTLTALSGNIQMDSDIKAQAITLAASGSAGGIAGSGTLYATSTAVGAITLTAGSGGIQGLNTSTAALTLISNGGAGGSSNMIINNTGSLRLTIGGGVSFDGVAVYNDLGSITTSGPITNAGSVILSTVGNNSDSIILGGTIGAGGSATLGPTSAVTLSAAGGIIQTSASNVISADSITLSSQNGNVGVPTLNSEQGVASNNATPIFVTVVNGPNPNMLPVAPSGTLSVNASNGAAYINNSNTSVSVQASNTAGDFQLATNGSFSVDGAVSSSQGGVFFTNTSTSGTVAINSDITATGGPVIIQNNNIATSGLGAGTITVGANVTLTGSARNVIDLTASMLYGGAGVALLSGDFPVPLPSDSTPAGITTGGSGNFNFSQGISATAPVGVNSASNTTVIMNCTSCTNANQIIVLGAGSGVTSSGIAYTISSLDLTSGSVVNALNNSGAPGVTSTLVAGASGGATSGTVTFSPSFFLGGVRQLNVPANVTMAFSGYTAANPVIVNILGTANGQGVITGTNSTITGTVQFVSGANDSDGHLFINSNVPGTVLNIAKTGTLTSDFNLTLNTSGNLTVAGAASASNGGALVIYTGGATAPSGTITPTTNAPGTMLLTGLLSSGALGSGGSVVLASSGSILQTAGSITADNVDLTVGGGRVSYAASKISVIAVSAGRLALKAGTGASVSIVGKGTAISVAALGMNVGNSAVSFSDGTSLNLSGRVVSSLFVSAPAVTTLDNVRCASCTFETASLTNNNVISTSDPNGTISITAPLVGGQVTLTGSGSLVANAGLGVGGANGVQINGGTLTTLSGTLIVESAVGAVTLQSSNPQSPTQQLPTLTAGTLSNYAGGPLVPTNLATSGSIVLTGKQGVSAAVNATTAGGDLQILSSSSAVNLQGALEADGGRILIGALSTITATSSSFTANAVGTVSTNSAGGSIEISSGVKAITPTVFDSLPGTVTGYPAFVQPSGTIQVLGSNVAINNFGLQSFPTGSVLFSGLGPVNLSTAGNQTSLNLSGGNIVFGTVTPTSSVQMDGSTLNVSGYSPIAFTSGARTVIEVAIDEAAQGDEIASVFMPGHTGACLLTDRESLSDDSAARTHRHAAAGKGQHFIALKSGQIFLKALCSLVLHSALADVQVRKGAILSATLSSDGLRIISCSGVGMVSVLAGGRTVSLTAGQEVTISEREVVGNEWIQADGIGRRGFHSSQLDDGLHLGTCDVSLVSMLLNLEHLRALKNPRNPADRKLAEELLHSAAAIELVTRGHGSYLSRPARRSIKEETYTPVSYVRP